jgi:ribose transport system substrate-binding protein
VVRHVTVGGTLVAVTLLLVFSSCGGDDDDAGGDTAASDGPVKVGMVLKDNVFEFWTDLEKGAREVAQGDVELLVDSPKEEDPVLQIAKVESMITRQVDALVVAPAGPQLQPVLDRATERGIPVVLVDTDIPGWDGKSSFVATDNVASAKAAVTAMVEELKGSGNLAFVADPGVPSLALRVQGAEQAVEGTDIEIVQTVRNDCDIEKAQNVTEDLLRAQPDLDAIFAACGGNSIGAAQAIRTSGKKPDDLLVYGHDGFQIELQAIKKGEVDGTVKQLPIEMGKLGTQAAVAAARDETVEPEIVVPFTVVTDENVDEFLE